MKRLLWLYPGMRIKRWIFLSFLGAMFFGAGLILITNAEVSSVIGSAYLVNFNFQGKGTPLGAGVLLLV
ncbi:MAG TPA: hypothetical protein VNT57_02315, partial [Desulfobacteria bacterium]|nr:hypothetical protein [Desulfobacteria bacterium]